MNNNNTEAFGTTAVKRSIMQTKRLSPYIQEKDKEPLWDGAVFLYHDQSQKNDNLVGRVPTQVKGKVCNDFSKKVISYPVDISALKTYQKDGGVIYFVVLIDKEEIKEKIYYAALTPVNIGLYLDEIKKEKQAEKSIKLKEFPTHNSDKELIFFNFFQDSKKQTSFVDKGFLSIEDLMRDTSTEYSLHAQSYLFNDSSDMYSLLLDNEVPIYATINGSKALIPTNFTSNELKISESIVDDVTINDKVYYTQIERIRSSNTATIKLGESIALTMTNIDNNPSLMTKIDLTSSLRQIVIDLEFIIDAIDNGSVNLGKMNLNFSMTQNELKSFEIEKQKNKLFFYKRVVKLLNILNVYEDINLDLLTQQNVRDLDALMKVFIDKQPIKIPKIKHTTTIHNQKIANITLKLIIRELDKENSQYSIEDFFSTNISMSTVDRNNGDRYVVSPLFALDKEDFIKISNINYEGILASYQKIEEINNRVYEFANADMLKMLSAYDETKNTRLFEAIRAIANWLHNTPNDNLSKEITLLNHLQIIKRERALLPSEQSEIYDLIEDNTIKDDIKVASYLLLDNQNRAEHYFNKLDITAQDNFKTYPIYYFWSQD